MRRSRTGISKLITLFTAVAIAAIVACSSNGGQPCYPGDLRSCSCDDGARGMQRCAAPDSGTHDYGACDCSAPSIDASTTDAAPNDAADAGESGLLGFMAPCTDNAQCETMLCFHFNVKGSFCSKPCTVASDCPPPSPGCSGMSVCKAP